MSIKNIDQIRDLLSSTLEKVASKEMSPTEANASANLVGKFLSTIKLEMEYNKMKNMKPSIEVMETQETKKIDREA